MNLTQKQKIHPVNAYALSVINGDIFSSIAMKRLCKRHIDDLRKQDSPEFHSYFDEKRALNPYYFAMRLLNVKDAKTGKRIPFKMINWQIFLTGMWNGWRIKEGVEDPLERLPDTRRFRKVFIISGKSSGKSPLAAFFAYWTMLEQKDAEGIVFAAIEDQARRVIQEMQIMQLNEMNDQRTLQRNVKFIGINQGNHCMARVDLQGWTSKVSVVSVFGNVQKKSSPILNFICAEEYNVIEDDFMLDVLEGGLKSSRQPLVLILANAGIKRQGPCWDLYKHSKEMLEGKVPNDDEFLPFIFEVDSKYAKAATEMKDGKYTENAKRYWPAANPSLGSTIRNDSIIRLLNKGKKTEIDQYDAHRLALSIWPIPGSLQGWLHYEIWERAITYERPTNLNDCDLYLGLDLGHVKAFSALAKLWYLGESEYYLEVTNYTHPFKLLERSKNAQFDFIDAEKRGEIKLCGVETQDFSVIARDILELVTHHKVRGMAVDMQFMSRLTPQFEKLGLIYQHVQEIIMPPSSDILTFVDHPQGAGGRLSYKLRMDKSMTAFEQLVFQNPSKVRIKKNALLDWQLSCAEVRRTGIAASQRRALDLDQTSRNQGLAYNDGIIALVQATGLAVANEPVETDFDFSEVAEEMADFYGQIM